MDYFRKCICILLVGLSTTGCAEKRTASDSGDDMYVVSDGMLAVDANEAANNGVQILDRAGGLMDGVTVLRFGLSISNDNGETVVIEASPDALSVLDANKDSRLDHSDPLWDNIYLAVDYNGDGNIGEGEYALIGECGIDALELDLEAGQAWSHHSDGETKVITLPRAS
jgi:hypothetical protein